MTNIADMPRPTHEGYNLKRIREMLQVKQEVLAHELGEDWNQKKVSLLENKEKIEPELLDRVAKVLKVPVDVIKNFSEEAVVNNIQNNYDNANHSVNGHNFYNPTFNPIDKVVELYESKIQLYERMLKEKDELIERLVGEKKK